MNLNLLFIQLLVGEETKEPENKAKEKNKNKKNPFENTLSQEPPTLNAPTADSFVQHKD